MQKLLHKDLSRTLDNIRYNNHVINNWQLSQEVESICSTYSQMLKFIIQGYDDPDMESMTQDLWRRAIAAAGSISRMEYIHDHPKDRYALLAASVAQGDSFEQIIERLIDLCANMEMMDAHKDSLSPDTFLNNKLNLARQKESAKIELFNLCWTGDIWSKNSYEAVSQLMAAEVITKDVKAIVISAVTLSLLQVFDNYRLKFLLNMCSEEDADLRQRAIVGTVLSIRKHNDILNRLKDTRLQLETLAEDESFVSYCTDAIMQLQYSTITDKISQKMNNDILPSIINAKKNKLKSYDDMLSELTKNGENPDWHDSKIQKKAEKYINAMIEMELDGADIYMGSMSIMKGHAFFSQMAHWFYPFNYEEPVFLESQLKTNKKDNKYLSAIINAGPFCNNDRYSLALFSQSFSFFDDSLLTQELNEGMKENLEALMASGNAKNQNHTIAMRKYVFDLYRFFKLYPFRNQFDDIFTEAKNDAFATDSRNHLHFIFESRDSKIKIADFCLHKDFYNEALSLLLSCDPAYSEEDVDLWQKIGFCCQKTNSLNDAFRAYEIANEYKPDSKWTLSHMAHTAYELKDYENVQKLYNNLLEFDSDNVKYLLRIADAYMQLKRYEDALQVLYKVMYLDEDNEAVAVMLAKSLLLTGDVVKTENTIANMDEAKAANIEIQIVLALATDLQGDTLKAYNILARYRTHEDFERCYFDTVRLLNEQNFTDAAHTSMLYDAVIFNAL